MAKTRKVFASTASVALLASAVVPAAVAAADLKDFNTVPSWATDAVQYGVAEGYFQGDQNGNFNPSQTVTRAVGAEVLAKALDLPTAGTENFSDVASGDWFYKSVVATSPEIFEGSNGKFMPAKQLTRQEAAKAIVSAFGLTGSAELNFDDAADIDTWAVDYAEAAVANGIIKGRGADASLFAPKADISKAEFAVMVKRAIDATEEVYASGVAGFVYDNGAAVEDAVVTVGGKTATTNAQGYYEVKSVAPGTHDVVIKADGYETVTVDDIDVVADQVSSVIKDIQTAEINTALIEVSGNVIDADTGAALDATVTLESYDEEADAWVEVASVVADGGAYTINQQNATVDLELGAEYRQTVSLDGYHDFIQTITLDDEEVVNSLNGISLTEIAEMDIVGTVTNAAGEKVSEANVTIYDAEGVEVANDTTLADGTFKVEDVQLLSGTYNVVVDDSSSAVSYSEFNVTEGTNATHNVQLEAGYSITANIGTESVNEVFGSSDANTATYTLELLNGKTVIDTDTFTSVDAVNENSLSFAFSRVAPGDYTLKISGDYVVTEEFQLTVDENETFENRAATAGLISGTVTETAGATVNLLDKDGNVVATTESGADGSYEFGGVVAGDYTVEVSKKGVMTEESTTITLSKNKSELVSAISLEEVDTTGDVAGYVRVNGSLAAVAGATVVYYDEDGEEVYNDTTDASGAYTISDVEAGTYDVVVRDADDSVETLTTTQTVRAGDNLTAVNYKLAKGGDASLEITVVDSEGNPVDVAANGFDLADAFVGVTSPSFGTWEQAGEATDTVTFSNLSAGTYDLAIDVASNSYVDVDRTVTIGSGEAVELKIVVDEVAAQSDVNFRVVDETNANVTGAKVVVFNADGTIKDILTTTSGTAALALVDGNYKLAVYKDSYLVAERNITIAGENVTVPVIQLVK